MSVVHGSRAVRYVDFDGTLAHFDGWKGIEHLGKPVPAMLEKVRAWLAAGDEVVIFTARIVPWKDPVQAAKDPVDTARSIELIQNWTQFHFGVRLPVTAVKGGWTTCHDDSIHRVVRNTGLTVEEHVLALINEEIGRSDDVATLEVLARLHERVAAL